MNSRKGKRPVAGKNKQGFPPPSGSWCIVLLDQEPLRQKAASECSKAMARLDRAKADWKRFETEDKAAYARWMAATFGAIMSRLREVGMALREKEALLQEVDMEMFLGGARTPRAAYARILKRRQNPAPVEAPEAEFPEWSEDSEPPRPEEGEETDKSAKRFFDEMDEIREAFLFEDYCRSVLGLNPDRLSQPRYDRLFAEFKQNVLDPARAKANAEAEGPEPPPAEAPQPAPEVASVTSRVKELYRVLVRRLHPDTRADSDVEVSALWHEVQEAYAQGNVERLEMLLALADIEANAVGDQTSVSQMYAVLAELRRSHDALQKNLRAARKDPAWNFSQKTDRSALEKRLRFDLQSNLQWQESELQRIEIMIASWTRVKKPRKKPVAKKKQKPKAQGGWSAKRARVQATG